MHDEGKVVAAGVMDVRTWSGDYTHVRRIKLGGSIPGSINKKRSCKGSVASHTPFVSMHIPPLVQLSCTCIHVCIHEFLTSLYAN